MSLELLLNIISFTGQAVTIEKVVSPVPLIACLICYIISRL